MRILCVWALFCGLALGGLWQTCARAEVLITEAEAKLPNAIDVSMTMRGLTRGPSIELLSPNSDQSVTSPLPLKIKFDIRNRIEIEPDSIKLTYIKANPVDLTDRIKKHVTRGGIEMDRAEVPPGTHILRLDIKDKQGRVGSAMIKLRVNEK
jgi:hypothetical protein